MTDTHDGDEASDLDLSRAVWHKSSYSGGNGSCVEVAYLGKHVAVRDSKNPDGAVLVVASDAWANFLGGIKGK